MKKLRIIFMGTPDFAVGILDTILKNDFEVAGVITAPDKPAGRGQKLSQSAVKTYALEHQLPILQPVNLKAADFLEELRALNANLQIVVAFRMLPEMVWKMPELGTFNLHASLLPDYRGAAPINWAIMNGETKTGVSTFFIDEKIDTGAVILRKEIAIAPDDTAGILHDKLMHLGSEAVIETLHLIENNKVKTEIQPEQETKTAYKLNKDNCKINWELDGNAIYNHIRGLHPYPAAWTFFNDGAHQWNVKIYDATYTKEKHNHAYGSIITEKKKLKVATKDGFIEILSLQFPGKKRMTTADLLNGISLSDKAFCN